MDSYQVLCTIAWVKPGLSGNQQWGCRTMGSLYFNLPLAAQSPGLLSTFLIHSCWFVCYLAYHTSDCLLLRSRLASCKLAFSPYTFSQLEKIIEDRINIPGSEGLVAKVAIQLAARKVGMLIWYCHSTPGHVW
jgi:hypothetical protein